MKPAAQQLVDAEALRHGRAMVDIMKRFPEYRAHLAYALLGDAIAVCDSFGCDVLAFIAELRRREPMPAVLVPPKSGQS